MQVFRCFCASSGNWHWRGPSGRQCPVSGHIRQSRSPLREHGAEVQDGCGQGRNTMHRLLVLTLSLSSVLLAGAQRGSLPQDAIALINAHVVNVADGTVQRNVTVLLRGGRIESVSTARPRERREGARRARALRHPGSGRRARAHRQPARAAHRARERRDHRRAAPACRATSTSACASS